MSIKLKQVVLVLGVLTGLFSGWMLLSGPFDTYYLLWNLFLAWIPMILSLLFLKASETRTGGPGRLLLQTVLGGLWLFFFPNAVYVVTDFIHLSQEVFYYPNPQYMPYSGESRMLYRMEALPWNNFFSISAAVFLGCALSALSLSLLHQAAAKKGKLLGWTFVALVHLLSGYAMYLGRFIRFNSWDVLLNPGTLLKFLLDNLHGEAFRFTISFGMLSFLVYLLFGLFLYLGPEDPFKDQRISRKSTE